MVVFLNAGPQPQTSNQSGAIVVQVGVMALTTLQARLPTLQFTKLPVPSAQATQLVILHLKRNSFPIFFHKGNSMAEREDSARGVVVDIGDHSFAGDMLRGQFGTGVTLLSSEAKTSYLENV